MGLLVIALILFTLAGFVGLGLFVYGIAGLRKPASEEMVRPELASKGFRVLAIDDGAGRYRIDGVRKESEEEVSFVVDALTRANAAAKAELRGVLVTAIEKVG